MLREDDDVEAYKITGANAGGPRQFPIQTPLAARVAQFRRSILRRLPLHLTEEERSPMVSA